jgi:hypothetical protein
VRFDLLRMAVLGAFCWAAGEEAAVAGNRSDSDLFTGQFTPWTIGAKDGAVGLFRPLSLGIGETADVTVGTSLVVGLIAPHVEFKQRLLGGNDRALAITAELGYPTVGLQQFQTGFLQPIRADQTVPQALVPGVGAIVGKRSDHLVMSAGLRVRVGVPFTEGDVTSQDLVWLDPAIAPITEGWSLQPFARVDWLPTRGWQLSAQGRVEFAGGPELSGRVFVLRALGAHLAVGAGASGAIARESYGWNLPAAVPLQLVPTADVQARW